MAEIKVYSVEEVAEILGVTKITVYSWLKAGKLKGKKIGKYWKVQEKALQEFLEPEE